MPGPDQRGLTLIELMLALALGGAVLLGARLLAAGAADTGTRAAARQLATDSLEFPIRTLRDLLRRVEVGTDSQTTFIGGPDGAAFTSWCDTAAGWQERCRVVIDVVTDRGHIALRLGTSTEQRAVVRSGLDRANWLYLEDTRHGGRWVSTWGTRLTAPPALLLILNADSLLLTIGERG